MRHMLLIHLLKPHEVDNLAHYIRRRAASHMLRALQTSSTRGGRGVGTTKAASGEMRLGNIAAVHSPDFEIQRERMRVCYHRRCTRRAELGAWGLLGGKDNGCLCSDLESRSDSLVMFFERI